MVLSRFSTSHHRKKDGSLVPKLHHVEKLCYVLFVFKSFHPQLPKDMWKIYYMSTLVERSIFLECFCIFLSERD